MAMSLFSVVSAPPECISNDGSSKICIPGASCASLAAPGSFGRSDRHGMGSVISERRLMVHAAKRKKGPGPVIVGKPSSGSTTPKTPRPGSTTKTPGSASTTSKTPGSASTTSKTPDSGSTSTTPGSGSTTFETLGTSNWEQFGYHVSGEWDGYCAEFNMFGEPFELPSNVVPEAFREWERKVHDWQTQSPTIAHPENGHLWYKVIKLLPTVGCEADAATVESVEVCDVKQNASALAYHNSGSYTVVRRGNRVINESPGSGTGKEITREGDDIEVEQCLVHGKTRIRVLQKLNYRRHVIVFREAREGPFRNGESLGGCAAVTSAFATEKLFQARELRGKWNSEIYTAQNLQPQEGYRSSELVSSGSEAYERNWGNTFLNLYLPKETWTLLLKTETGGTTIETGWLVQPDQVIVTKCEIGSSGNLMSCSLRLEKRISSEVAPVNVSAEDLEELLIE